MPKLFPTYESSHCCIRGLAVWVIEELEELEAGVLVALIKRVARIFVQAAGGSSRTVPLHEEINGTCDDRPPVIP